MPASSLQHAKRSFVTVLLTIAAFYSVRLPITRDASDEDCTKAFKRVSLKAHPDKGGLLAHSQALNAANETWDKARRNNTREREGPKKRGSGDVIATQTQPRRRSLLQRARRTVCARFAAQLSRRRVQPQVTEGTWATPSFE